MNDENWRPKLGQEDHKWAIVAKSTRDDDDDDDDNDQRSARPNFRDQSNALVRLAPRETNRVRQFQLSLTSTRHFR